MPWKYCINCGGEVNDWREAFEGCKSCGEVHLQLDDGDVKTCVRNLMDEIDELKEEIFRIKNPNYDEEL
ncbi:MAG: hypothetical protein JRE23_08795 [Deltaproteobacteria bacterium]|nr:hypothetical protein [Deltaproteobacteria bacterium]